MIDAHTALIAHWHLYLIEAFLLGMFMVSASLFGTLLFSPHSPAMRWIPNDFARLCVMGASMGLTASLLIYSSWGQLSGAQMNPAVTLTMLRLGNISLWDALFYCLFQTLGGTLAVYIMAGVLGKPFTEAPVSYLVTVPGKYGVWAACATEFLIAFVMMSMVRITSSEALGNAALSSWTGVFAGGLVATFVVVSGPVSGFGMNPARTLASAVPARRWDALWLYLLAPPAGMLAAAEVFYRLK